MQHKEYMSNIMIDFHVRSEKRWILYYLNCRKHWRNLPDLSNKRSHSLLYVCILDMFPWFALNYLKQKTITKTWLTGHNHDLKEKQQSSSKTRPVNLHPTWKLLPPDEKLQYNPSPCLDICIHNIAEKVNKIDP